MSHPGPLHLCGQSTITLVPVNRNQVSGQQGGCQWNTNFFKLKACLERDKGSKNIPALLVCSFLLRQFCFQEAVTQWPQPLGCTVHSTASVDDGNKNLLTDHSTIQFTSISFTPLLHPDRSGPCPVFLNYSVYVHHIYPSLSSWPVRVLP